MVIEEAREEHGDREPPQAFMFSSHQPLLITEISFFGHISFLFRFRHGPCLLCVLTQLSVC